VKKDLHKYLEREDFTIVLKRKKSNEASTPSSGRRQPRAAESDDSDGEIPSSQVFLRPGGVSRTWKTVKYCS
jgi:hypothetical protein